MDFHPLKTELACRLYLPAIASALPVFFTPSMLTGVKYRQAKKLNFFPPNILEIQIFIAKFGFCLRNTFKWVQTSLVLVQWLLR